jgi:hypothetical protein
MSSIVALGLLAIQIVLGIFGPNLLERSNSELDVSQSGFFTKFDKSGIHGFPRCDVALWSVD